MVKCGVAVECCRFRSKNGHCDKRAFAFWEQVEITRRGDEMAIDKCGLPKVQRLLAGGE